jgi:hypothetical protein
MDDVYQAFIWKSIEPWAVPKTPDEAKTLRDKLKIVTIAWHRDNHKFCHFAQLDDMVKNVILHWPKLEAEPEIDVMFILYMLSERI